MATVGPHIVTDGLVLILDSSNTKSYPKSGNTWSDLTINNNDGTLEAGVGFNGLNLGSMAFNNINDYIEVPQLTEISTSGTISMWFNPTIGWADENINMRISGLNDSWEFGRMDNGNGAIIFDLGETNSVTTTTTSFISKKWYNLTVTWDTTAQTSKVYLNGILEATGTYNNVNRTGLLTIGRSPGDTTEIFLGRISTYIHYSRTLSSDEIYKNYNANKGRYLILQEPDFKDWKINNSTSDKFITPLNDQTNIGLFDPNTTNLFGSLGAGNKWYGGVLAPNGKIYGMPYFSTQILEIDPITQTTNLFGDFSGSSGWIGGVLTLNGKIYTIPFSSTQILEIGSENKQPENMLLSRYLNKF